MNVDLIIQNGTIVTADEQYVADVAIQGEEIVSIGKALPEGSSRVIDATGKYVFPGGIDVHTHLDLPVGGMVSKDNFTTGTIAAACGGTTTILDFCTQFRGQSLREALAIWHEKARGKAVIDYGFHIAITDLTDAALTEMRQLVHEGYPSYKFYMAYQGLRVNDEALLRALVCAKECGGLVCVHAENFHMINYLVKQFLKQGKLEPKYHPLSRPPIAEGEAVGRAIQLAELVGAPLYIVHLTCLEALKKVEEARREGHPIMAETCIQYLLLSEDRYREPGFQGAKYVISPPLRAIENQTALWKGLGAQALQVVSTDHCPFDFKGQKDAGRNDFTKIPNGMAGIEARLALLFDRGVKAGKISINRFVELISTNPAKIFGMYPKKGSVTVGADADLVIFDPTIKKTITKSLLHENVDYTPYEGLVVTGYPVTTISRGAIIVDQGQFIGAKGAGKFVPRKTPMVI